MLARSCQRKPGTIRSNIPRGIFFVNRIVKNAKNARTR